MPRDPMPPAVEVMHPVYEDLPDFILAALSEPDVENILLDPGGLVRRHKRGIFDVIGQFENEATMRFLRKVASEIKRYFNNSNPFLRAILPNRERIEAVFPNVSVDGLAFVLRVPGPLITLAEQVDRGTMTEDQRQFIEEVAGEKSIVVIGEAGAGKTNLLRGILDCPKARARRICSIEADPEVQKPENGVRLIDLEPEPGMPDVPFMRLLRAVLRLLPQLVVVSEVITAEHAQAFVHASRGHVGMSSFHARNPLVAVGGIQELGKAVGGIPTHDVALACEIIVQIKDVGGGRRLVSEIATIGVNDCGKFTSKRVA